MHSEQILNRVFPTKRDGEDSGEALLGPAKNSLTLPPHSWKDSLIVDLTPTKFLFPPHEKLIPSLLPLNNNFQVITQLKRYFQLQSLLRYQLLLISYPFDTQVKLILILIDVQYSQNAVSSFEKGSNCQNHSSGSRPIKKSPPGKFPITPHPPLTAIWKTLLNYFTASKNFFCIVYAIAIYNRASFHKLHTFNTLFVID